MTDLRFIGDLSLVPGLMLAVAAGCVAWWLYVRELSDFQSPVRWILPALRSSAIVLTILILTAPVLHHRYREGEPGRLVVMVDSSESMSIHDSGMKPDRKLAISNSLGWSMSSPGNQASSLAGERSRAGEIAGDDSIVIKRFDESTRYQRAVERLLDSATGVLPQVQDSFEVSVSRFDREQTSLWESTLRKASELPKSPQEWFPPSFAPVTRLGDALESDTRNATTPQPDADGTGENGARELSKESTATDTLVVLTDGRNNQGVSPLTVAEALAAENRRLYVIGLGDEQSPEDVSILAVNHPERVFQRDVLRGTIVTRYRMAKVEPLRLSIRHEGETVWEETHSLTADDRGRVNFTVPVEPIVQKIKERTGRSVEFASIPLHLEAVVQPQSGESVVANNVRPFHVSVITKQSRMLVIDGRSRWEVRYLRNMFERDPAWKVDSLTPDLTAIPPALPRGDGPNQWPTTREKLAEYDLIALGDVPPEVLPADAMAWLKYFVESSGGGLIVIDGARGHLKASSYQSLHEMLPVKWLKDNRIQPPPVSVSLSTAGRQLAAFQLVPGDAIANERTWAELPQLHFHSLVESLPGSEVLAVAKTEDEEHPIFVTRQYGAGRVLYCATDETWRWRYKVADTYHQRFWNQMARWVMRLPMTVQGEYVGIDAGKLVYAAKDPVLIRARLRTASGEPAKDLAVEALIVRTKSNRSIDLPNTENSGPQTDKVSSASTDESEGQVIAVVPLDSDKTIAGVYSGQFIAPEDGNYIVKIVAPGLTRSALDVSTEFTVADPDSGEMDQLACDTALLKRLAEVTGGQYLPEERGHELVDLLKPLSRGKIVESDTLLWQSYWWFLPIVVLLCIEWWIRKRVGLI